MQSNTSFFTLVCTACIATGNLALVDAHSIMQCAGSAMMLKTSMLHTHTRELHDKTFAGSSVSRKAFQLVLSFAAQLPKAKVYCIHVFCPTKEYLPPHLMAKHIEHEYSNACVSAHLENAEVHLVKRQDGQSTCAALAAAAQALNVDTLFVGSFGRKKDSQDPVHISVLGSVADQSLRSCTADVCIVKSTSYDRDPASPAKILVPVDLSEKSGADLACLARTCCMGWHACMLSSLGPHLCTCLVHHCWQTYVSSNHLSCTHVQGWSGVMIPQLRHLCAATIQHATVVPIAYKNRFMRGVIFDFTCLHKKLLQQRVQYCAGYAFSKALRLLARKQDHISILCLQSEHRLAKVQSQAELTPANADNATAITQDKLAPYEEVQLQPLKFLCIHIYCMLS